jgi:hypothetical protein
MPWWFNFTKHFDRVLKALVIAYVVLVLRAWIAG